MSLTAAGLLVCCLGALWLFVRKDVADYAAFKQLSETADRQRRFRLWALKSLALFSGATVLCLALLGRLADLTRPPAEFAALSRTLRMSLPAHDLLDQGVFAAHAAIDLMNLVVRPTIARLTTRSA